MKGVCVGFGGVVAIPGLAGWGMPRGGGDGCTPFETRLGCCL